jgi:hypothetical protein
MSTGAREAEDLAKLAVGGKMIRNGRIRRALIARLLSERGKDLMRRRRRGTRSRPRRAAMTTASS